MPLDPEIAAIVKALLSLAIGLVVYFEEKTNQAVVKTTTGRVILSTAVSVSVLVTVLYYLVATGSPSKDNRQNTFTFSVDKGLCIFIIIFMMIIM